MSIIKPVSEDAATGKVKKIYEEIKEGFNIPFVPNLFKMMAHNPDYLQNMWERIQVIMSPGKLDRKTKEIIALAVSATNNCEYCINAHSASLQGMGLDESAIVELMAVVDLFNGLNKFADGLEVEIDLRPQ